MPFDYLGIKGTTKVTQTSNTESVGVGYNLAASLKITEKTTLALTYRSKTHFNMRGSLNANSEVPLDSVIGFPNGVNMNANLSLSMDIADVIRLGLAHHFEKLLAEFVYEHTFGIRLIFLSFNTAIKSLPIQMAKKFQT